MEIDDFEVDCETFESVLVTNLHCNSTNTGKLHQIKSYKYTLGLMFQSCSLTH